VLQARVARYPEGEIRFNVLAMVGDLRQRAREFGDAEALRDEERKRRGWMWENALRRHNFVGFTGEVLRAVVKEQVKKGEYEAWVKEGTERTSKQMDARRARRAQKGQEGK
jgi:ubiquitin carboxyl-terminal hydrolase L5